MRIVLQVGNGPHAGRRIWLFPHQRLTVGNSEWADWPIVGDGGMAQVHFHVECGTRAGFVRNLSQQRPLTVNGERVQSRTLVDGDIITAGGTNFSVAIRATEPADGLTVNRLSFSSIGSATARFRYSSGPGAQGVVCYSGRRERHSEVDVARLIGEEFSFYLVVHTARIDADLAGRLRDAVDLSDLAPAAEQVLREPVCLITPATEIDRHLVLRETWNPDATCAIFSSREPAKFLELLRQHRDLVAPPSSLRPRFKPGAMPLFRSGLGSLKAILLEMTGDTWGVFVNSQATPAWRELGFPAPPADSTGNSDRSSSASSHRIA